VILPDPVKRDGDGVREGRRGEGNGGVAMDAIKFGGIIAAYARVHYSEELHHAVNARCRH